MGMPSGMELLVILGIIVLLFGAKKIPDLAKGIGQGIKNFKKEMKDEPEEFSTKIETEALKKVEANEEISSVKSPKTSTQA